MKDGAPFVFAGLWEGWKDPVNNEWLHTYSIITGEPNEFAAADHTRMPIILPEEHHDAWLFVKPEKKVQSLSSHFPTKARSAFVLVLQFSYRVKRRSAQYV
jgi:putative SOS response-associated peptidase YedK